MDTMIQMGVTGIIELAPGGVLTGLAKRAMKGVPSVALKTPDDLAAALELARNVGMTLMRTTKGPEFARIRGLGVFRGENAVPNDDIIGPINSSDEWIRKMTGIATRVRANADTSVIDMAEGASRQAIEQAGIAADEIDAVILSTITFPHITPGGAPVLADRLGTTAAAFDISAACAGYCYGIGQADSLVRSGPGTQRACGGRGEDERLHRPRRPVHLVPARRRRRRRRDRRLGHPGHRPHRVGI